MEQNKKDKRYHGKGGGKRMWEDKRSKKRQKTGEEGRDDSQYVLKTYTIGSEKFEEYYRT